MSYVAPVGSAGKQVALRQRGIGVTGLHIAYGDTDMTAGINALI